MLDDCIRLDDLLKRNVDVQWFEGVAIVQSLCRQLLARSAANNQFPEASAVAIQADGAVKILGTTTTKAAAAAAHLLAGMLSSDVPVRLRLIVTGATGNTGDQSLRDLFESLTYFERPGAESILQALYERAMLASARAYARPSLEAAAPAAIEQPSSPQLQRESTKRHGTRRVVAAASLVAVSCAAAAWATGVARSDGRVAETVRSLKEALTASSKTSGGEVRERPPAAAGAKLGSGTARSGSRRRAATEADAGRLRNENAGALLPSTVDFVLPLETIPRLWGTERQAGLFTAPLAIEFTQTGDIATPASRTMPLRALYSEADADVVPPRQVYPALPARTTMNATWRVPTLIELVIGPDGLVERVHARTPPRDVHEFMLLSAAKAWRFEPATRDGRPVRFLYTIPITKK